MHVTKGIWHMRKQCVPGSLSSSPAQEPGNEAKCDCVEGEIIFVTPRAHARRG